MSPSIRLASEGRASGAPASGRPAFAKPPRRFVFPMLVLCLGLTLLSCSDSGTTPEEHDHDHEPAEGNCGHLEGDGYFLESDGALAVFGWRGDQTGELSARVGELGPALRMNFISADSVSFGVADNCEDNALGIELADESIVELVRETGVEWTFRLRGLAPGSTTLVLRGMHEGHSHIATLPIPVTVSSAPTEGLTLSGRVDLEVTYFAESGDSTATESYPDQSGIRVYLESTGQVIDSTLTDQGVFQFHGLSSGTYDTYCGPEEARSEVRTLVLTDDDGDTGTIRVRPIGKLRNPPNPFEYSHGTGVEWDLASSESVEIRIFAMTGHLVWSYAYDAPAGFQHIHWIGTDQVNTPLPPGPYWATARYDGRWHSRVVIKLPE